LKFIKITFFVAMVLFTTAATAGNEKLIIAHRGVSGYLPEHTLASKAMAHTMDADYIEQDVIISKDDHLIVLHDRHLDRVTNETIAFRERHRMVDGENVD